MADALARVRQLGTALAHRTVIARAQGILMERYDLDGDAAQALLVRASNTMNIRVYDIAQSLVETKKLPREITDTSA